MTLLECVTQKPGCSAPILSSSAPMITHSSPHPILPKEKVRVDITAEMNSGNEISWDQQLTQRLQEGPWGEETPFTHAPGTPQDSQTCLKSLWGRLTRWWMSDRKERVQKPRANWVEINKLWLQEAPTEGHCPEVEISLGNRKASRTGVSHMASR